MDNNLDHDPHAAAAMAAYAQDCKATHPALSVELSVEYPTHCPCGMAASTKNQWSGGAVKKAPSLSKQVTPPIGSTSDVSRRRTN